MKTFVFSMKYHKHTLLNASKSWSILFGKSSIGSFKSIKPKQNTSRNAEACWNKFSICLNYLYFRINIPTLAHEQTIIPSSIYDENCRK